LKGVAGKVARRPPPPPKPGAFRAMAQLDWFQLVPPPLPREVAPEIRDCAEGEELGGVARVAVEGLDVVGEERRVQQLVHAAPHLPLPLQRIVATTALAARARLLLLDVIGVVVVANAAEARAVSAATNSPKSEREARGKLAADDHRPVSSVVCVCAPPANFAGHDGGHAPAPDGRLAEDGRRRRHCVHVMFL
jgi:hypothetical protein